MVRAVAILSLLPGTFACAQIRLEVERNLTQILSEKFPEYEVAGPWRDDIRLGRRSPEYFVGDILFGDFNRDEFADFAAVLVRKRSLEEAALDPDSRRRQSRQVYIAVICNGTGEIGASSAFDCFRVDGPVSGSYVQTFDYVDWTIRTGAFENHRCEAHIDEMRDVKSLVLQEDYGHCSTVFVPRENLRYRQCRLCVD